MTDLDNRLMEGLKRCTREQKLTILDYISKITSDKSKKTIFNEPKEQNDVFNITDLLKPEEPEIDNSTDMDGDGVEDEITDDEDIVGTEDDTDFDIEDNDDSESEDDDSSDDEDDDDADDEELMSNKGKKVKKAKDEYDFDTEEDDDESEDDDDEWESDDDEDDDSDEDSDDDYDEDDDDEDYDPKTYKKGKAAKPAKKPAKVKFDEDDYDTWTADNAKQVIKYIKGLGVNVKKHLKGTDAKIANKAVDIDDDILTYEEKIEKLKLPKLLKMCEQTNIKVKGRTEATKKQSAIEQLVANYIEENYG